MPRRTNEQIRSEHQISNEDPEAISDVDAVPDQLRDQWGVRYCFRVSTPEQAQIILGRAA